jgi:hypothetical protein
LSNGDTTNTWCINTNVVCPGCDGKRVQKGNDGINIVCPVCKGEGTWYKQATITPIWIWYPYYPYVNPTNEPYYTITCTTTNDTNISKIKVI